MKFKEAAINNKTKRKSFVDITALNILCATGLNMRWNKYAGVVWCAITRRALDNSSNIMYRVAQHPAQRFAPSAADTSRTEENKSNKQKKQL